MLKEREKEQIGYRVVEEKSDVGESIIQKTGMVAEFTMNDIDRDLQLLRKKKEELESQKAVEDARMVNIDRTNPEVGQMDEKTRQVVYIYERAYAFSKVATEKIAEIDTAIKSYKDEMLAIALETGIGVQVAKDQNEGGN